jgi:hypothetical protein
MATLDGLVERAYIVSVEGLREICKNLTDGNREYNVTCDDEETVAISYQDAPDDLNTISYTFPILRNLNLLPSVFGKQSGFGEDGLIVCLHIYMRKPIRGGLYFEGDELSGDFVEDWEKFWRPLEAALNKELECQNR